MSESEWNASHPGQARAIIESWEQKRKREAVNQAHIELVIASSLTKRKGGGDFTIDDFLPEFCKPKRPKLTEEQKAERLRQALANAAKQK